MPKNNDYEIFKQAKDSYVLVRKGKVNPLAKGSKKFVEDLKKRFEVR